MEFAKGNLEEFKTMAGKLGFQTFQKGEGKRDKWCIHFYIKKRETTTTERSFSPTVILQRIKNECEGA